MKILYFFSSKRDDSKAHLFMEMVIITSLFSQIPNYAALKTNSKWQTKADFLC